MAPKGKPASKAKAKPAGITKPTPEKHARLTRNTSANHKFLELSDGPKTFPAFEVSEYELMKYDLRLMGLAHCRLRKSARLRMVDKLLRLWLLVLRRVFM